MPISLIMVDIDFFKAYNATYGHQAGDDCLKQAAGLLKRYSRRAGDFPARYGGEAFAVVLSGTGTGSVRRIAEELRAGVESLGIPHERSSVGDVVTVSAGVATVVPHDGLSSAELIHKADSALYRAKEAGRNRVVVDHTLPLPEPRTGRGQCGAAYLPAHRRADAAGAQSRCGAPGTLRLGAQPPCALPLLCARRAVRRRACLRPTGDAMLGPQWLLGRRGGPD